MYRYYLAAVGLTLVTLTIVLNVIYQGFIAASGYWLSVWSTDTISTDGNHKDWEKEYFYVGVYALLGIGEGERARRDIPENSFTLEPRVRKEARIDA